jgi:hypothetical protein
MLCWITVLGASIIALVVSIADYFIRSCHEGL